MLFSAHENWLSFFFCVFGCRQVTIKNGVWEWCPQVLAGKAREKKCQIGPTLLIYYFPDHFPETSLTTLWIVRAIQWFFRDFPRGSPNLPKSNWTSHEVDHSILCGKSLTTSDDSQSAVAPLGRTPKGAYSSRGRSRRLLETPFSETLFYCRKRPPSQNPSGNPSQNLLRTAFRTLCCRTAP